MANLVVFHDVGFLCLYQTVLKSERGANQSLLEKRDCSKEPGQCYRKARGTRI